jgi:hypothetical protein
MDTQTLDLLAGVQLRDIGVQKVYDHNKAWVDKARSTAKALAALNGSVSIDDVLSMCNRPEAVHPNATGTVFRENVWEKIGYRQSAKPSAHARVVGIYKLKDYSNN